MGEIRPLSDFFKPQEAFQAAATVQQLQQHERQLNLTERLRGIEEQRNQQMAAHQLQLEKNAQTQAQITGLNDVLKQPGLPLSERNKVFNQFGKLVGIQFDLSNDSYIKNQGIADDLVKYTAEFGKEDPRTIEKATELMHADPDLHAHVKRLQGISQLTERATGKAASMEEAGVIEGSKEMQGKLGEEAFKSENMQQAKIDNLKAKTADVKEHAGWLASQAGLADTRVATYAAKTDLLKAQSEVIARSTQGYKDLKAQAPQLLEAIGKQEATYHQDLRSLNRTLQQTTDPATRDGITRKIAARELMLRSVQAEKAWVNNPMPENYKLYRDAEEAVNKELGRSATTLQKLQKEGDSLAQARFADKHAKDYQSMYEKTIKVAGLLSGEQIGGISISQGENGQSDIQIGGQVKDPVKLGKTILAEVKEQDWLPSPVKDSLTRLGERLTAGKKDEKAEKPQAASPTAEMKQSNSMVDEAVKSIRERLGLK